MFLAEPYNPLLFLSGKRNVACVLSAIKSAVIVSVYICSETDISSTVQPIGANFCTFVELQTGHVFFPFGGDIFRGLQMRGSKVFSDHFLASQIPNFPI